jgi:Flp pilus assembly protein TadD
LLFIYLLILAALKFLPFIFKDGRFWGFGHLIFLPDSHAVILVVLCLLASIIFVIEQWKPISPWLTEFFDRSFYTGRYWISARIGFVMLMSGLFSVFVMPNHFLGDGYSLIANLGSETGTFLKWSEQGITYVLIILQSLLGEQNEQTARISFQIISIISGAVSIWFYFAISNLYASDSARKVVMFLAMLFSGTLLLFFGYVENYPFLWVGFLGYFYFGMKYIKGGGGFVFSLLFLLVSIFIHLQAIVLVPSFMFIIFCRGVGRKLYDRYKIFLLVLLAAVFVGGIVIFIRQIQSNLYFENIFLPLFGGKPSNPGYGIISIRHIVDILNLIILLSPLFLAFLIFNLARLKKVFSNGEFFYLALISVTGFTFVAIIDPKLGMARDWDLFSTVLIAPTVLLIMLISARQLESIKKMTLPMTIFLLAYCLPFLSVNTSQKPSIDFAKHLITLDKNISMPGLITLRDYYKKNVDTTRADSLDNLYPIYYPNQTRMLETMAALNSRNIDEARRIFTMVKPDRFSSQYHELLHHLYRESGNYVKSLEEINKALQLQSYNSEYYRNRAIVYGHMRQYEKSLDDFRTAYQFNSKDKFTVESMAFIYLNMRRLDSAYYYGKKLIAIDSTHEMVYYLMTKVSLSVNKTELAKKHFQLYLKHGSTDPFFEGRKSELEAVIGKNE